MGVFGDFTGYYWPRDTDSALWQDFIVHVVSKAGYQTIHFGAPPVSFSMTQSFTPLVPPAVLVPLWLMMSDCLLPWHQQPCLCEEEMYHVWGRGVNPGVYLNQHENWKQLDDIICPEI